MYEILIHTREYPQGKVFEQKTFPSKQAAQKFANQMSLGWRFNGYCTVRKRGSV